MEGLQVLSLGMSRTGTASMKEALLILGHKRVHHAYELYSHSEQCDLWLAAWDAKAKGLSRTLDRRYWENILAGYTAVTDMPAVCFAEELIDAFPEAKVILVQRHEQKWTQSFKTGVIDTFFDNSSITALISFLDGKLMRPIHRLWSRLLASDDGFLKGTTRNQVSDNAINVYRDHNALVKAKTAPENLLLFDLNDGWEPLCAFLGAEVPDVPFPNVNEGDAVKDVVAAFMKRSMLRVVRNLTVISVGFVAVYYAWAWPLRS